MDVLVNYTESEYDSCSKGQSDFAVHNPETDKASICRGCQKHSEQVLCENAYYCRRAFDTGKSDAATSIEIINGYTLTAELLDGKVYLHANNSTIGGYGDSWLLGVMTFDEEGKFKGKQF